MNVRPVRTRRDLRQFVHFPYELYTDTPYWIPPLRRDQAEIFNRRRNPFFEHGQMKLFLATDESGGRTVGRIAGIINGNHLRTYSDGVGFFGFYESIDHDHVANLLLGRVKQWLSSQGLLTVRGPVNPTLNDSAGVLVEGFDREPSVLMPYNPPYYQSLFEQNGFVPCRTLWAYYGAWRHMNRGRLRRAARAVQARTPEIEVRSLSMSHYEREVRTIRKVYNASFADTWGFVPVTPSEFAHASRKLKSVLDPELIFILRHHGEPVGFSLSIPNANQHLRHLPDGRLFPLGVLRLLAAAWVEGIDQVRTALLGVLPAFRHRGLEALLILETIEAARRRGYQAGEMSWVMDNNPAMSNALEKLGAVIDKTYALYQADLS